MWMSSDIKMRAKIALRYSYGMSLLAVLIIMAISMVVSRVTLQFDPTQIILEPEETMNMIRQNLSFFVGMNVLSGGLNALVSVFLFNQLNVGFSKFFLQAALGKVDLGQLFAGFRKNYKNILIVKLLQGIFIFLWSLLFVIPGIIKMYQYFFVDYILAENPSLNYRQALDASKAMTDGNKFRIFMFELSFIGWMFLGMLACGIGVVFVYPYLYASITQLYMELKHEAIDRGTVAAYIFHQPVAQGPEL